MKRFCTLWAVLAVFLMTACGQGEVTPEASLSAVPSALTFEASGNPGQKVTVKATNVKWEYALSASGKEWIAITQEDNVLNVTVSDNVEAEARTAIITIKAVDNMYVKPLGITVSQNAGTPEEYELTVDPSSLSFEGKDAQAQQVKVQVSSPELGWTVEPEGDATWIHTAKEGEYIRVTVDNNPNTAPRAARLIVTPDKKSAAPKSVRVEQAGKKIEPSLTVTPGELSFDYQGYDEKVLTVNAVEVEWNATTSDEEGLKIKWISVLVSPVNNAVVVKVERNETLESRSGYVVVTSNVPEVPEVRVLVTQEAGVPSMSNLTESVNVADMQPGGGFWYNIFPNQKWDKTTPVTEWNIELWGNGLTRTFNNGYYTYSGSGSRFAFKLYSESIPYNDEEEFSLPEGDYVITPYESTKIEDFSPFTVEQGEETNNMDYPSGCWYTVIEDGQHTKFAPLMEGKVRVTQADNGDYTFIFDFVDDAGHTISGTCTSAVTDRVISFFEENEPSPNPDPNPNPDPDFPVE